MNKACSRCQVESDSYVEVSKAEVICCTCAAQDKWDGKNEVVIDGPECVPTQDEFILMCRRFSATTDTFPFSDMFLDEDGLLCYTNGHVLLSDIDEPGSEVVGTDVFTLTRRKSAYPSIAQAFSGEAGGDTVEIPEDFYECLSNMFDVVIRSCVTVVMDSKGIFVEEEGVTMTYSEVVSPIKDPVAVDGMYMHELRPSRLRLSDGEKPISIESSYIDHVERRKHVIVMPTSLTGKQKAQLKRR